MLPCCREASNLVPIHWLSWAFALLLVLLGAKLTDNLGQGISLGSWVGSLDSLAAWVPLGPWGDGGPAKKGKNLLGWLQNRLTLG